MTLEELHKKFLPNPDDVILIKSLFLHPGWKRFEERIQDNITVLDANIEQLTNGSVPINMDRLDYLNQQAYMRRTLKLMLLLRDELLGEVDPNFEDIEQENFSTEKLTEMKAVQNTPSNIREDNA